jgi:hypothetical protein
MTSPCIHLPNLTPFPCCEQVACLPLKDFYTTGNGPHLAHSFCSWANVGCFSTRPSPRSFYSVATAFYPRTFSLSINFSRLTTANPRTIDPRYAR